MVMFGLGMSDDMKTEKDRKKFMGLASVLESALLGEDPSRYSLMVDTAAQLRNMLRAHDVVLARAEKVRVVKSITKAKVKAFMEGTPDSYRTFKTLDTISNDLVQLM
jgi:hypothetical protein